MKPDDLTWDKLLLHIQRALVGQVSSSLRAVVLRLNGNSALIKFFFDGEITDLDWSDVHGVYGEGLAYYYDPDIQLEVNRLDMPKKLPSLEKGNESWVFMRRE